MTEKKPSLYALVGMKHRNSEGFVATLPNGEDLELVREPGNKFDPLAVQVWARGRHVGYVSAKQVKPLALAMDTRQRTFEFASDQARMPAKLHRSTAERWPLVEVP